MVALIHPPETAPAPPVLQPAAAEKLAAATPAPEESKIGRAMARGAAVGFVTVLLLLTWLGVAAGLELGGAIGLGACVGIWGGAGFGAMMGGTIAFTRESERERQR